MFEENFSSISWWGLYARPQKPPDRAFTTAISGARSNFETMEDRAKYLVHADLVADGVVERNDVVGAVFGQTEGLLGDDLDIRDLQDSAKVGRLDVEVESENGQSYGHLTVASNLDRVETAIFAASLEAIERIGPCRATVEVQKIEDVRAAKRREIVDRAKQLLATSFDEGVLDSDEILTEVRESVRAGRITEYEGLPAGPHVETSEAIVVVEGRSDVLTLLRYGIKNAIGVEGTNVPDAVADLTHDRTTTVFLDGDRGGDLILEELKQIGAVDYVARAPAGTSVEDLTHAQVDAALRNKRPADIAPETTTAMTDGSRTEAAPDAAGAGGTPAGSGTSPGSGPPTDGGPAADDGAGADGGATAGTPDAGATQESKPSSDAAAATPGAVETEQAAEQSGETPLDDADAVPAATESLTIAEHTREVEGSDLARLLDGDGGILDTVPADAAFDAVETATEVPVAVVVDARVEQRLVDVAAQRGVSRLVGSELGDFVKQPVGVRVLSFDDL